MLGRPLLLAIVQLPPILLVFELVLVLDFSFAVVKLVRTRPPF
jgi:hypothetical protein